MPNQILDLIYIVFWSVVYFSIVVAIVSSAFFYYINKRRKQNLELEEYNLTFLQIKVPQTNEIEPKVMDQLFSSLAGYTRPFWKALMHGQFRISFEVVSKFSGIGFYVVVPDEMVTLVEKLINGAYPTAEIDVINPNEIWDRGTHTVIADLKLKSQSYYPIKTYEELSADGMSAITSSMSKLNKDEVIAIQYIIQSANSNWRKEAGRFVSSIKNKANDPEKKVSVDTSITEGVEKKLKKPGFDVAIRVMSISSDKFNAEAHVRNVSSVFEQFSDLKYNKFVVNMSTSGKLLDAIIYRTIDAFSVFIPFFDISFFRRAFILNSEELATIFHFPNKNVQTPNIIWLRARRSAAPSNLPTEGLYLGNNIFRNVKTPVFMLPKDRTRHFYIIGQTGTGKSELMKSLAIQDIHAGHGMAFIDPHGSDVDDILQKIPPERKDDVILFDVSDSERPFGLNLLNASTDEEKNMAINAFIGFLYKMYDPNRQGIMGPQLERQIRNVMLTAMVEPTSTMIDVMRMMIDNKYSERFLPKLTDPLVRRFWTDEMAKTSDYHKSEKMGYIVSKFDRFVTDKTIRNIIGQPVSSFNFHELMAEKKILLVDLSKGKIGEENSNFIGLMLVPKILQAALARANFLGKQDFPDFFLYIDEFQNFATPDIATILSEARKYKLNLVVAHQFISQLTDDIKEAIFGNVGSMSVFRVGADDAKYLEEQFAPTFTQSDMLNNPIGNFYTRLLVNGQPTEPFSVMVDWKNIESTPKDPALAEEIRMASRMKYGKPVDKVTEYINLTAGIVEEAPLPPAPQRLPF